MSRKSSSIFEQKIMNRPNLSKYLFCIFCESGCFFSVDILNQEFFWVFNAVWLSFASNGRPEKQKRLAAMSRRNHEETSKSNRLLDTNVPRIDEDYITQVPGEIEERGTLKLSHEFSGGRVVLWALCPS